MAQSSDNSELLREALLDMERLREQEVQARQETEVLLNGLYSLSRAESSFQMFEELFSLLRESFDFEDVLLLQADKQGVLSVRTCTNDIYGDLSWVPGPLFKRVLEGEAVALFDSAAVLEWQGCSETIRARAVSVLHAPLQANGRFGMLIGTQRRKGAFTREHVSTIKRMVLLIEQALVNAEARESFKRESALMVRRDELQSMVDEQTADLMAAKEEAEAANASKNRFLASLTHELRTPLHAVISFSELGARALNHCTPEKLESYFNRINCSGKTLLNLVNQLLDLAKMEAGKMEFEFDDIHFTQLIQAVMSEFDSLAQEKQVGLIGPSGVYRLKADSNHLKQVVRNLLSNALKFAPKGTDIRISVLQLGDKLRLDVDDEGAGIPVEDQESVFEHFKQSRQGEMNVVGTGLGLAICREIVNAHEGRIWVETSPAGGASFRVLLPDTVTERRAQGVA